MRNGPSLAKLTNGYLSVHSKEINATDCQITVAVNIELLISIFPPSTGYCMLRHTRNNFLLVVTELGTLQEVKLGTGKHVYLLEAFCEDCNDILTKVIFWAGYAEKVCN